jgi:hypothetical protein
MGKQPNPELTLALDGEVSARDLASSAAAFAGLLEALTQAGAPGAQIDWIVTDLRSGSAETTALARPVDVKDPRWISNVIDGSHHFGDAMESGDIDFPGAPRLRAVAEELRGLVRGNLIRVRFESPERDFVLVGKQPLAAIDPGFKVRTFGAIRGRVQSMSNRGTLRFTLYDLAKDKPVSCYLANGQEENMLEHWGKFVEVEGWIRRDPETGRPLTIRDISHIEKIHPTGSWRHALGAAQGYLGSENSEDVIRRGRDE